jgi:hypothetical protein
VNLATLDIPPAEAKARLAEYEAAVRVERNAQDEAIAMGYRAAARGLQVIRLSETIRAGGFFEDKARGAGFPRIAVGQATETECRVHWDYHRGLVYFHGDSLDNRGALVGAHSIRVPGIDKPAGADWRSGRTIMPLIPPRHRPKFRRLRHCHLLWEVESWELIPPKDPALIRHIRGDLWAVLSVWDLTELERAVLAM